MAWSRKPIEDPEAIEVFKQLLLWLVDNNIGTKQFYRIHGIHKSVLENWIAGKCLPTGWNFKKFYKACYVKECPLCYKLGKDYFKNLPDR